MSDEFLERPKREVKPLHPKFIENQKKARMLEYRGETKSLNQWSKIKGLPVSTVSKRLNNGWSVEQALDIPPLQEKNVRNVNPDDTTAKKFRDKLTHDLFRLYVDYGRNKWIEWAKQQFDENPGKFMKDYVFPNVPKETFAAVDPNANVRRTNPKIEIAVISPNPNITIKQTEGE